MSQVILGDCVEELKKLPENSVDSIVTDPPYGLKFMGKEFDDLGEGAQQREWHKAWAQEALRVLKPGGHLIAFGGTRTYHHLATAVEEAGFEIRDQIQWLYGSGFPKSLNVGKAIDRKRDDLSQQAQIAIWINSHKPTDLNISQWRERLNHGVMGVISSGGSAQSWTTERIDGSHKPRVPTLDQVPKLLEVLGVKPEEVPEDIARLLLDLNGKKGQPGENWFKREVVGKNANVEKAAAIVEANGGGEIGFGAGSLNADITAPATEEAARWEGWGTALKPANEPCVLARKPFRGTVAENVQEWGTGAMNIDGCRVGTEERTHGWSGRSDALTNERSDASAGLYAGKVDGQTTVEGRWPANVILDEEAGELLDEQSGIKEGPARFFYCPKAGKKERNAGLESNKHPTVKPVKLMAYLIRLVTPPGGTVLDPFLGSGSTALAAIEEGFSFIGIEQDPEYIEIAKARIKHWEEEAAAKEEAKEDTAAEKE